MSAASRQPHTGTVYNRCVTVRVPVADSSNQPASAAPDPHVAYHRRVTACRAEQEALARRDARIAYGRLIAAAVAAAIAWLVWRQQLAWWWLGVPAAGFVALVIIHDRVIRARRRLARIVAYYERGLARIEDRWMGQGESGARFRIDTHLFAADLDLFGDASLFQLLNTAQTRAGEETLASWLLVPASRDIVLARQAAVQDLTRRMPLREDLATAGVDVRAEVDPEALASWATGPRVIAGGWRRAAAPILGLCAALATIAWATSVADITPLLILLLVNGLFGIGLQARVSGVLHAAADPARELTTLAMVLERVQREDFAAPRLLELRQALQEKGGEALRAIRRLRWIVEVHDWQHNVFFAPIGSVLLLGMQCAFAIEAWRERHGQAVTAWLRIVGELEAFASIAAYAYEHPSDPFPEIAPPGATPIYEAEQLAHPLIPRARAVPNDVRLGPPTPAPAAGAADMPAFAAPALIAVAAQTLARAPAPAPVQAAAQVSAPALASQALIVSGSNMSGKSTLLRSVGINAVLALAGAPVRATRLRLSPVAIGATLRIQDSLQAGRSRFYAEITRVRALVDLARTSHALLFLLDELFHGTNSHDRVAGAQGVLKSLLDLHAIGLVTTHDLALAALGDELAPRAINVHFDDSLAGDEMVFDYRLKPGPVTRSNAIALMKAVGLDVEE
jgi:hypothetical protein